MRFLVVGQGGREHAIVRALKQSPSVTEVHAAPGSAGMAQEAICHALKLDDWPAWGALLKQCPMDCVVIGPEVPLAGGLADFLRSQGVPTVGPNRTAAQLESSKLFSKEFMRKAHIPTARFEVIGSMQEGLFRSSDFAPPYVLKVDGLAAGKGVFICADLEELKDALRAVFENKQFGAAGQKALLEEFQSGYEVSYLVLTNGTDYQPLPVSQDHKRLLDGDKGPNTGGMGVVGPVVLDSELVHRIQTEIIEPTLKRLSGLGLLYRGVLYFGVMVTPLGPQLLEYNVRFGDPEAQVILPLLDGDWGVAFLQLARGEMPTLKWKPLASACVVMAAPGYPDAPEAGVSLEGDWQAPQGPGYFLHAGTRLEQDRWVTAGGRVLNAVATGTNLAEAVKRAYEQAGRVHWRGLQMRRDIGQKQI